MDGWILGYLDGQTYRDYRETLREKERRRKEKKRTERVRAMDIVLFKLHNKLNPQYFLFICLFKQRNQSLLASSVSHFRERKTRITWIGSIKLECCSGWTFCTASRT